MGQIMLDGNTLKIEEILKIVYENTPVSLSENAIENIKSCF